MNKDSHDLCTNCCGKVCNANNLCERCHNWSDEKWEKVNANLEKLVVHYERKACSKSSFTSFSGFSSPSNLHVPL